MLLIAGMLYTLIERLSLHGRRGVLIRVHPTEFHNVIFRPLFVMCLEWIHPFGDGPHCLNGRLVGLHVTLSGETPDVQLAYTFKLLQPKPWPSILPIVSIRRLRIYTHTSLLNIHVGFRRRFIWISWRKIQKAGSKTHGSAIYTTLLTTWKMLSEWSVPSSEEKLALKLPLNTDFPTRRSPGSIYYWPRYMVRFQQNNSSVTDSGK